MYSSLSLSAAEEAPASTEAAPAPETKTEEKADNSTGLKAIAAAAVVAVVATTGAIGMAIAIAKSKRGEAKGAMEQCFAHIKTQLLEALRADPAVDRAVFSGALTEGAFVDLVTDNLLLIKGTPDCAALEALVRRVIYR